MTTEQPNVHRTFRRRSDDRVIGGVASGLGDFLNVDPLLIRIGFVGLMVFGGLGLVLYVLAWLAVPDEASGESIAEQLLDRVGVNTRRVMLGALFAGGTLLFVAWMSSDLGMPAFATGAGVAIVVIVAGAVILRQGEPEGAVPAPRAVRTRQAREQAAALVTDRQQARVVRRRRPRSPLAGYVVGAMLAAIGLFALVTNVASADVDLGQFFGLALGVIGIGQVVGAWWGRARVLILLGLVVLPFAVTASFMTAPIQGGIGDHRFTPTSLAELRDEYRLAVGQITLDLRELADVSTRPIEITASVAAGGIFVLLPEGSRVDVDSSTGAGDLSILGAYQAGTALNDRHVVVGHGPRFVLHLEAGIGGIQVDSRSSEWN